MLCMLTHFILHDLTIGERYKFRSYSVSIFLSHNIVFKHPVALIYYLFHIYFRLKGSRGSVVGIATGYGLDDLGVGVRVPV
jgi:hypothetical protein